MSLRFKQSGGRTTVYASSHRTNFVVNATEEIALHTEHTFQILKGREALRYGCQSVTRNETPQHTRTKPPKSPFCTCLQLPHSPPPRPRSHFRSRCQGYPLQMASVSTLSYLTHPSSLFQHEPFKVTRKQCGWQGRFYGERWESICNEQKRKPHLLTREVRMQAASFIQHHFPRTLQADAKPVANEVKSPGLESP